MTGKKFSLLYIAVQKVYVFFKGKGMNYMPGTASLAATHRGKVKNIRLSTLRDNLMTPDPKTCILHFEQETKAYDSATKKETQCKFIDVTLQALFIINF